MSTHDERQHAEALDALLDDPATPTTVPRAQAATAQALARSAERLVPDAAFAARLEQRLRALPPNAPLQPHPLPWLAARLRPAGRLVWAGGLALLVLAFALALRSLSSSTPQAAAPASAALALPPACQSADLLTVTHVELADGYCFTYPPQWFLTGAGRGTVVLRSDPTDARPVLRIASEAANGRTLEALVQAHLAPRSLSNEFFVSRARTLADQPAHERRPRDPASGLVWELWAIVGERALHLSLEPLHAQDGGSEALWEQVIGSFAALPAGFVAAHASCPQAGEAQIALFDRAQGACFLAPARALLVRLGPLESVLGLPQEGQPLVGADSIPILWLQRHDAAPPGPPDGYGAPTRQQRMAHADHQHSLWLFGAADDAQAELLWSTVVNSWQLVSPALEPPAAAPPMASATAAPQPTATAIPLPPTWTPVALPLPAPVAQAARLTVESISPNGRFVAYWEHSAEQLALNEQEPPGTLRLYDRQRAIECNRIAQVAAPSPAWGRSLFWLPGGEQSDFVVRLVNGTVLGSYPCADEGADRTERFPEPPLHMEPLDAEGARWLVIGPDALWLLDWGSIAPAQPITGLPGGFNFYRDSYRISPDGQRIALNLLRLPNAEAPPRYATYLVDSAGGSARLLAEWEARQALGAVEPPTWLGNARLLIAETADQGPLLLGLEPNGTVEVEAIVPSRFASALPSSAGTALVARGVAEGDTFHLLLFALPINGSEALPASQLYHSETGAVEPLPFAGQSDFTPDGQALLLRRSVAVAPNEPHSREQLWLRPVEAPQQAVRLLLDGTQASEHLAWSPDRQHFATWSLDGQTLLLYDAQRGALLRQWQGEGAASGVLRWTPDGSTLIFSDGQRLRLVPIN